MTQGNDETGIVLKVLAWIGAGLATLLSVASRRIYKFIRDTTALRTEVTSLKTQIAHMATKEDLRLAKVEILEADEARDRAWLAEEQRRFDARVEQMEEAFGRALQANREDALRMHAENLALFREMRDNINRLLLRGTSK